MDTAKIDYILDIFKTLTNELPEQMLYRDNGDSIELKTLDSLESIQPLDMMNEGWSLIGSRMVNAA